jgi:hypothetical protein
MRRLSHFLLTMEAIALIFLTVIASAFLLGGSAHVWTTAWAGQGYVDALTWTAMLLSLVAAWWQLGGCCLRTSIRGIVEPGRFLQLSGYLPDSLRRLLCGKPQ